MTNYEIIHGIHAVHHTLEHSIDNVFEVWIQKNKKSSEKLEKIITLAKEGSLSIQYVSRQALDKQTGNARHQGVSVKCKISRPVTMDLKSLLASGDKPLPLYLVLDGIQDPHNLGACLRTANASGVNAVIIPKDKAVGVNATVRKVASGAAEHIPVLSVTNLARTLREMRDAGIWIIGTAGDAEQSIYEVDLNRPLALVMGTEGKGLRQNTRKQCDVLINIPMMGNVESLNVSVAAGVCLYEAVRQQMKKS